MAKWQITQTRTVGDTTINTWEKVQSLAEITAEFNRKLELAKRLTQRAADFAAECAYDEPCKQCIHPTCKNYAKRQNR